jgi:hypothetical protein
MVTVDLFGVGRDTAAERLLAAAEGGRGKPDREPAFPGQPTTAGPSEPTFPGPPQPVDGGVDGRRTLVGNRFTGPTAVQIGDHNTQTNTFGN